MRGVVVLLVVAASGCLIKPSAPAGSSTPPIDSNIVFVTSQKVVPIELGSVDMADTMCNTLAMRQGLPGQYVAWLSTTTEDAKDRLGGARGWRRPDGQPFADTVDDMLGGVIFYPVTLDETDHAVDAPDDFVVTGTGDDGKAVEDGTGNVLTCGDWTVDTGNGVAGGFTVGTTGRWTFTTTAGCTEPARLYCFGVDRIVPVAPPPVTVDDRIAFITSSSFQSGNGVGAADGLCQKEGAVIAGHGPFVALLADEGAAARDRIPVRDQPFVRLDGVVAVTDPALTSFDAPVNVGADGKTYIDDVVFVGSNQLDATGLASDTCGGWTGTSASMDHAVSGYSSMLWPQGLGLAEAPTCDTAGRVLCFEQRM